MLYYRAREKIVLTVHNVNARKRDRKDSALNRFTLGVNIGFRSYLRSPEQMKRELVEEFGAQEQRVSVIPWNQQCRSKHKSHGK